MFDSPSFRRGFRDSALIAVAVAVFGLAYGVVALDAGLTPELTLLSSVVTMSGAAQFAMVGLLAAGAIPVLIAATGLGLRHLPMSARMAEMIGPQSLRTRLRLAFVLVDESFGLTLRAAVRGVEDLVAYKSGADLALYAGWLVGTAGGVWFGSSIDPEAAGIGVLFGLLFLGLAAPMVHTRRDWVVVAASVVATVVATETLPVAWQVTVAATAAALIGVFVDE
ncbi:MAG: AzlC family ABC transporter permease [Actinomycetota bacterium]|nr:AzlC family ABC transporter permease [Actinomycetota bacterium]